MAADRDTFLITGGGSGIGLELAGRLSREGHRVLICGRDRVKLERAEKAHPGIAWFQCDLSRYGQCAGLAEWIGREHPGCNVLVNNAAVVSRGDFLSGEDMIGKARLEIDTNLLAPIVLTRLLLPVLERNPRAQIVNVNSGLIYAPRADYPFYNAAKAALHAFTQVLRSQMEGRPVRVREVMLPAVDTPWHQGRPPRIAIPVEKAVDGLLEGLAGGREEIRVGGTKALYLLSRIAPGLAFRMINAIARRDGAQGGGWQGPVQSGGIETPARTDGKSEAL